MVTIYFMKILDVRAAFEHTSVTLAAFDLFINGLKYFVCMNFYI